MFFTLHFCYIIILILGKIFVDKKVKSKKNFFLLASVAKFSREKTGFRQQMTRNIKQLPLKNDAKINKS